MYTCLFNFGPDELGAVELGVMRVRSVSSLLLIVAILLIMAVLTEVFVDGLLQPMSLFKYLLVTALGTGVIASVIIEKINAKILD